MLWASTTPTAGCWGHFGAQAQQDVYGNGGNVAVAAVIGPRGKATRAADGSFKLSGFWPCASGNASARWLLLGCDAVEKLYTIGGASGLSLKSPIQRAAHNLQATNMHGFLLYDSGAEIYGRILLGLDPGTGVI